MKQLLWLHPCACSVLMHCSRTPSWSVTGLEAPLADQPGEGGRHALVAGRGEGAAGDQPAEGAEPICRRAAARAIPERGMPTLGPCLKLWRIAIDLNAS